jgi:hypothetical protein
MESTLRAPLKGARSRPTSLACENKSDGKRINALDAPRIPRTCRLADGPEARKTAGARRRKPELVLSAHLS